jgi:hypothetical protein
MAVLMTLEFEASLAQYDEVNEKLGTDRPAGLIAHTGVDLNGKMKVVDIWESAEDFQNFMNGPLGAAVGEVLGPPQEGAAPPQPQIEEIHDLEVWELHTL